MLGLERAQKAAEDLKRMLGPYCTRIEVAGSVRRKKSSVHDIDFVVIAPDAWNFSSTLMKLGSLRMSGAKVARITTASGIQLDFYFASPENFATLFLIRTGSVQSNIRLCSIAKRKGWHLAASGDGLFNEENKRIAGDTEESIFEALGLPYMEPEERI